MSGQAEEINLNPNFFHFGSFSVRLAYGVPAAETFLFMSDLAPK